MMPVFSWFALLGLAAAYLMGAFPSAYLAGKARGVDLRQHGSGNLGATNAVRVLGKKIGIAVFLVDILKGFLPVFFIPRLVPLAHPEWFAIALGIVAIAGHVRSIFLVGKGGGGGKGVATAAGVFLALAWLPTLIALAVWIVVFLLWRYVSLASLAAAAVLPLAFVVVGWPVRTPIFVVAVLVVLFVFYTHRANIGRLRRGEESHFRRNKSPSQGEPRPS